MERRLHRTTWLAAGVSLVIACFPAFVHADDVEMPNVPSAGVGPVMPISVGGMNNVGGMSNEQRAMVFNHSVAAVRAQLPGIDTTDLMALTLRAALQLRPVAHHTPDAHVAEAGLLTLEYNQVNNKLHVVHTDAQGARRVVTETTPTQAELKRVRQALDSDPMIGPMLREFSRHDDAAQLGRLLNFDDSRPGVGDTDQIGFDVGVVDSTHLHPAVAGVGQPVELLTPDGRRVTPHDGAAGVSQPQTRAAIRGVLADGDHNPNTRIRFWEELRPALVARINQEAGETPEVHPDSIVPWVTTLLTDLVRDENVPYPIVQGARQLLDQLGGKYRVAATGAKQPIADFEEGREVVAAMNDLNRRLAEQPLTFAEMVAQGIVVVDPAPVYRRTDDGTQGQEVPYVRVTFPQFGVGMYMPRNINLNTVGLTAARPMQEIVDLKGIVMLIPGIGSTYAEARTMINPGLTFYGGVEVADKSGSTKKAGFLPVLVDATGHGLSENAPPQMMSREGTNAFMRLAMLTARNALIEAKSDALLQLAAIEGKKAANAAIEAQARQALQAAYPNYETDLEEEITRLTNEGIIAARFPSDPTGAASAIAKKAKENMRKRYPQYERELNGKKQELFASSTIVQEYTAGALAKAQQKIGALTHQSVPAFAIGRSQGGLIALQAAADFDPKEGLSGVIAINPSNTSPRIIAATDSQENKDNLTGGVNAWTWSGYLKYTAEYTAMQAASAVASMLLLSPTDLQYSQGYKGADQKHYDSNVKGYTTWQAYEAGQAGPYDAKLHQYRTWVQDFIQADPAMRELVAYFDPPIMAQHNVLARDEAHADFYNLVVGNMVHFFMRLLQPDLYNRPDDHIRAIEKYGASWDNAPYTGPR